MEMEHEQLAGRYRRQALGLVTAPPGHHGAIVEHDGGLRVVHYRTHAAISHGDLPAEKLDELITGVVQGCDTRGEPIRWTVFGDTGQQDLVAALTRAGFAPGASQTVNVARLRDVAPDRPDVWAGPEDKARRRHRVSADGRDVRTRRQAVADGWQPLTGKDPRSRRYLTVAEHDGLRTTAWVKPVAGSDFVELGLLGHPAADPVLEACAWARRNIVPAGRDLFVAAHVDNEAGQFLRSLGFTSLGAVTQFHRDTTAPLERQQPVGFPPQEIDELLDLHLGFDPQQCPRSLAEPPNSVTWDLRAVDQDYDLGPDKRLEHEVEQIIRRGLGACLRPHEPVYWIDWQHTGYSFEPTRVGGPGQAAWPGCGACPEFTDFVFYLAPDLRLGTMYHSCEPALCVFGTELLAAVEDDLTRLLRTVIRRGGRNMGNAWRFE